MSKTHYMYFRNLYLSWIKSQRRRYGVLTTLYVTHAQQNLAVLRRIYYGR